MSVPFTPLLRHLYRIAHGGAINEAPEPVAEACQTADVRWVYARLMEVVLLTPLFSADKGGLYRKKAPDYGGSRAMLSEFDHLVELAMTHDPFLRTACRSCTRHADGWIAVVMHEPSEFRREDLVSIHGLATAVSRTNSEADAMRDALALVGVKV